MISISVVLRNVSANYELRRNGPILNQFFFMDDLKLFSKTEPDVERLVEIPDRLYMKRSRGRHGLIAYGCASSERRNMAEYFVNS